VEKVKVNCQRFLAAYFTNRLKSPIPTRSIHSQTQLAWKLDANGDTGAAPISLGGVRRISGSSL
jgi:hypothetical protein